MNKDNLLELLRLLKPKFYNRITWLIVGGGLAMLSKPIILILLGLLLDKVVNFDVFKNDEIIGISLVLIGLIYNVIIHIKENPKIEFNQNSELTEHDRANFKKIKLTRNFIEDFKATTQRGLFRLSGAKFHEVNRIYVDAFKAENLFLDSEIHSEYRKVISVLGKLVKYLKSKLDYQHLEIDMYREKKLNRKDIEYICKILDELLIEYEKFRRHIKVKLKL